VQSHAVETFRLSGRVIMRVSVWVQSEEASVGDREVVSEAFWVKIE
jgi:hypothetical protein